MIKTTFRRMAAIALSLCLLCGVMPLSMTASAADIAMVNENNFTFLWVTDPQIYTNEYPHILSAQNDWILDNANRLKVKYAFHTGDLVHVYSDTSQWEFVSKEYKKWDDAGFSYGVLAGNHDMSGTDYSLYSQYFGASRYNNAETNWWYGGDYKNNYGHYDLRSTGGADFIFVYLSYGDHTQADYDWVNSVLKAHSDRIAILNFHDYMATKGGRSEAGEKLFENIVLKNPNVRMVLCGHNYNSNRTVDEIDDNGDGIADRTVYQIMANYQYTTNGGNGFIRFMECDVANGRITHRTYSPYTGTYGSDYDDGSQYDEFGTRDSFVTPFDFSTPAPKQAGDPESGKVVYSSEISFAQTTTQNLLTLPVVYQNQAETGATYKGVGVYDRFFSLDAADAFTNPSALNFVITQYNGSAGYSVKSIVKGSSLGNGAVRVPIPKNGAVITLPANVDLSAITVGRMVTLNKLVDIATPTPLKSSYITVPSWGASYAFEAVNRPTGNGEWVIYDSLANDTDAHQWDMLFAFTPVSGSTYQLTQSSTAIGKAKSLSVPANGFVLAVNTVGSALSFVDSVTATFTSGLQVTLSGHTPGKPVTHTTVSLLAPSASAWTKESTMVVTQSGNTQTFYNTDSLYPKAHYNYPSAIVADPSSMVLTYDYMAQTDTRTCIILFFKGSSGDRDITLQQYFEGASLSTKSGDLKGDDVRRSGKIDLSTLDVPAECYDANGKLTLTAIRIFASGAANTQTQIYTLALTTDTTSDDTIARNVPLLGGNIAVSDPQKAGGYVYDNGKLTMTADSDDGYEVVVTLGHSFNVNDLSNLVIDVSASAAFDIRPVFTTSGDDASYGLASDFWPNLCGALVNGYIPAGQYAQSLDLRSCFTWNKVLPADGITTVKRVSIALGGKGSVTVNALQAANTDSAARFEDGLYVTDTTPNGSVFESDVYIIGDTFIEGIAAETTVSALLSSINSSSALTVMKDGNAVDAAAFVETGMTVRTADGTIVRTLAVTGDVDGNGLANTLDARECLMAILNNSVALSDAQRKVADYNNSGDISTADVRDMLLDIVAE